MATQVATGWVAKGEINFPLVFHLDEADKDRDDGGKIHGVWRGEVWKD